MVYQPIGLSETIFQERYAIHPEETWDEMCVRVANHVSKAEVDTNKKQVSEEFYEELATNRFMPGGRILYGSNRTKAQLINCYVIGSPNMDSREGWGKTISDVIVISGTGGGVGINFSPVRPRGTPIQGIGGIATGAVSLMQMINGVGDVLVGGGGRRLALMFALNISHPDMPEFLDKKLDRKELTNANISLILDKNITATKLIKLVKEGKEFDLTWNKQRFNSVNAKEIWERVVRNAWESGEPGILGGDLANKENNIAYYKPLISVNPCGEQWLESNGCCDLGALVLPRFVRDNGTFDFETLSTTIKTAVRFLDNVLSINDYPLPEIRDNCVNVRRVGLGIMGLHSMLIGMGYRYSSDAAKGFIDQLMHFIKLEAYEASVKLAEEKGAFPAYSDDFLDSGFIRRAIPHKLQMKIRKNGIRNCALLTIAPTGTTSMVSNVSSGIEPLFAPAYWRRFYRPTPDGSRQLDKELVIDPLWTVLEKEGKDTSVLEGAYDIDPIEHLEIQRICQKHIDAAVSKTVNLPKDFNPESLSDLWLEYLPYLKGTTFYRAGSRGEEPLEAVALEDVPALLLQSDSHLVAPVNEQSSMDCVGDTCAIPENLKPHIREYDERDIFRKQEVPHKSLGLF